MFLFDHNLDLDLFLGGRRSGLLGVLDGFDHVAVGRLPVCSLVDNLHIDVLNKMSIS